MVKFAEKLTVLSEHGNVLLQKMYLVKKETEKKENEELCKPTANNKNILKCFNENLEFTDSVERQTGYDSWFKPKMSNILKSTTPWFCAFREWCDWCDVSARTLEEIASTSSLDLAFDTNMAFIVDFLDTLSLYAKLALLVERIPDKKVFISLYNLSYAKTNGRSEDFVKRISQMFKNFSPQGLLNSDSTFQTTLKTLRASFYKISPNVGKALINAVLTYEKGSLEYLTFKRPLELLSDPDRIPYPACEDSMFEMLYHQQITDWVVFGYICCPEGLGVFLNDALKGRVKTNRGILFLTTILNQNIVTSIFGDEIFYTHEVFEDIFHRFKGTSIQLKNEKKVLRTAEDTSISSSGRTHFKRRTYLRIQLRALLKMLHDFPGLICPKFQHILSCLHLTKVEINWYFLHYGIIPKYGQNVKKYKEVPEPYIGELIYLVDEIVNVCLANKDEISSYHLDFLKKVFVKKITNLTDQVINKFDGSIKQLLLSFAEEITHGKSFVAFRVNLKRLQILFSGYQYKTTVKEKVISDLLSTLNTCYHISKNIDEVELSVANHAMLKDLYYYEPTILKLFSTCLTRGDNAPLYALSYIRLINTFQFVAHKSNFEYRQAIGNASTATALKMINSLIGSIEKGIGDLRGVNGFENLAQQIGGDKVGYRLRCKIAKVKEPPIPGEESMFDDDYVKKLRLIQSNLTKLLFSLNSYSEITIYDTVFYPSEFLRERVEIFIQKWVYENAIAVPDSNEPEVKKQRLKDIKPLKFLPPSVLEEKLAVFMFSLKFVEQCININLEELVLASFLENFVHLNYVENAYSFQNTGEPENTVLIYSKWYSDIIADAIKLKFFYSPLRKTFISTKDSQLLSYKIEEYCDFQELTSLARLIGPYGIRVFDQQLLAKVHLSIDSLKQILGTYKNAIKEVANDIYKDKFIETHKAKFKGYEKIWDVLSTIGGLLVLRVNLRDALEISIQNTINPIYNLINDTFEQYPRNYYQDEKLSSIDGLALDCGIGPEGVDNGLKKIATSLSEGSKDWEILPHAFACLFYCSTMWAQCDYNPTIEGWSNNTHLMIPTIHNLLIAFNSTSKKAITEEYTKYAELSAAFLLTSKMDKNLENYFVFTDKVVRSSLFYDHTMFEEHLPYSLTRNVYSKMYAKTEKEK